MNKFFFKLLLFTLPALSACFKEDITAPVITLKGSPEVTLPLNIAYKEAGYTAFDNRDKDITKYVEVTGKVDTAVAGIYSLFYSVKDASGNPADTLKRTVTVIINNKNISGFFNASETCDTTNNQYIININYIASTETGLLIKNLNQLPDSFLLNATLSGITGQVITIAPRQIADTVYSGSGIINSNATQVSLNLNKLFNDTLRSCTINLSR